MRILFSLIFTLWGTIAVSQEYPAYSELYVNDFAGVFNEAEAERLRGTLQELREARGIEFTVVTLRTLSEHGHDGAIEPFATGLFNHWGIGNATRNDGLLMLVVRDDRAMRIEVGSGYGTSLNGTMQRVIDDTILPEFRDGDYVNGILSGVDQVIFEVTGVYPGDYDAPKYQVLAKQGVEKAKRFWPVTLAILAPIGFFLLRGVRAILRRRPRRCPNDGTWMIWLSEKDDDQYLFQGQVVEETLKSVDYDVWLCPECDHAHVIRRGKWVNSYEKCPRCDFHTLKTHTTVISMPSEYVSGEARDDHYCVHCDESWSATRRLPQVPKRRSTSSSSGGFGGGSSSGGGASGRW